MNQLNLTDYGFSPRLLPENSSGIPARVTSATRNGSAWSADTVRSTAV